MAGAAAQYEAALAALRAQFAEPMAEQQLLEKYALLSSEKEKLLEERARLNAENEQLIRKLNAYRAEIKEFVVNKATMQILNMSSVLEFILHVNEALVVCEVGLKERRHILAAKLPARYSKALRKKDYSDGHRLKMAIARIEKQFRAAGERR